MSKQPTSILESKISSYELSPICCKHCSKPLPYEKRRNKFCSKNCAASFNGTGRVRTAESKKKISLKMRLLIETGSITKPAPPRREKIVWCRLYGRYTCHGCLKEFWRPKIYQVCCSIDCRDRICSQNKCKKTQIEYFNKFENKTIYLQSTWEQNIADLLTKLDIYWTRPSKRFKWTDTTLQKKRTYLPDFYLPQYDLYLDVKNPHKKQVDHDKISQLTKLFPLYVGTLSEMIDFIKRQTGVEPAFSSIT